MDLKEIQKPVAALLEETNIALAQKVKTNVALLKKISDLTPISKGKKIRSTLLFLLSGMHDSFSTVLPDIAASIEMFHLSSLIHDDVMDNSESRRGEKTLNTHLGNLRSVLWGDYLFISSLASIHNVGNDGITNALFEAVRLMVEGQLLEAENCFNFKVSMEAYRDVIDRKTSSLFAAVTRMVSILNTHSPEKSAAFYRFGMDFGTIFQVSDDILDIFSQKSGKDRFRDLEEGKITLPFILLMRRHKGDIKPLYMEGNRSELLRLFEKYNIQELCLEEISTLYNRCLDFLKPYPDGIYKESLRNLLAFIRYREY
ncbi:MAG: polyprenyl synthetase family protein [bacterium]|nr:polyprenyl synthetase family protein [bacterium]